MFQTMFKLLAKWYSEMDEETVELFKRFIAKCYAEKDPMGYLKQVLRRELDKVIEPS